MKIADILRWQQTFLTGCDARNWMCQQDSYEYFQCFELLINTLKYRWSYSSPIFGVLCDLVTSLMMLSIPNYKKGSHKLIIHMYVNSNGNILGRFISYHETCSYCIYKRNIEGRVWGHPMTSSMTSLPRKLRSGANFGQYGADVISVPDVHNGMSIIVVLASAQYKQYLYWSHLINCQRPLTACPAFEMQTPLTIKALMGAWWNTMKE